MDSINTHLPSHIACPKCGIDCTHPRSLEIFARPEDGHETSIAIDLIDGQQGLVSTSNPSPRRQGFRLLCRCEAGCDFELVMIQHKGFTSIAID